MALLLPLRGQPGHDGPCHARHSPPSRRRARRRSTYDASACTDEWLRVYRQVQQRLFDGGYEDLLPDRRDFSPFTRDARSCSSGSRGPGDFSPTRYATRSRQVAATDEPGTGSKAPVVVEPRMRQAHERAARQRTRPGYLRRSGRSTSSTVSRRNQTTRPPQKPYALRSTQSARQPVAPVWRPRTEDERRRWRVALEALGGEVAAFVPSREPGEDDETVDSEAENDRV